MRTVHALASCLVLLAGCKIVFDKDRVAEIPAGPEGDAARNSARLEQTFDSQLIPLITTRAVGAGPLQEDIRTNLEATGELHGHRGAGAGSAWHFAVRDSGTVISAKLDTRARNLDVDIDDDGTADATVQLGPVIRGTALRDVAPFYNFDEFRDQIEFAKLARAINDKVVSTLNIPDGELLGQTVSFTGVVPVKKSQDRLLLTPIIIEFSQ